MSAVQNELKNIEQLSQELSKTQAKTKAKAKAKTKTKPKTQRKRKKPDSDQAVEKKKKKAKKVKTDTKKKSPVKKKDSEKKKSPVKKKKSEKKKVDTKKTKKKVNKSKGPKKPKKKTKKKVKGIVKKKSKKKKTKSKFPGIKKSCSAFILFHQDKRLGIQAANPDVKFIGLSKMIGEAWHRASEEEKSPYVKESNKSKEERRRMISEVPVAPKKPKNMFFLFNDVHREKVTAANPTLPIGQIQIILGNMWRKLGKDEKETFQQGATKAREEYTTKRAAFVKEHGSNPLYLNAMGFTEPLTK